MPSVHKGSKRRQIQLLWAKYTFQLKKKPDAECSPIDKAKGRKSMCHIQFSKKNST